MRIAEAGPVEAVTDLAALISLCAQLRADGLPGDGEAWAATAATLGRGEDARARLGSRPGGRTRPGEPPAPVELGSPLMLPLAAKTAAQEGLDVIKAMLVVGLIFLSVIVLGELTHWLRHRRH